MINNYVKFNIGKNMVKTSPKTAHLTFEGTAGPPKIHLVKIFAHLSDGEGW